jgi:microcystin-dependent protein
MSTITTILSTDHITDSRAVINTNFGNLNTDKIETSVLDTDTSLAANSDAKIPSQKAVKAYVDAGGNVNASTTTKGIVEEATSSETALGTAAGGTGARLFVNPSSLWMIGEVRFVAFSTVPTGWLECDGSAVSRSTYSALFSAISTTFGTGDGSSTFNLPDLRGRSPIGKGANTWTTTFAAADVNTGTDVITVPSNTTLYTGKKIQFSNSGGALPTGISAATDYYVVRLTATTIKIASSRANALGSGSTGSSASPTTIDITAAGSGTNTITVQDLTTRTLGEKGGEETHNLTIEELVGHAHTGGVSGTDNNDASLNSNTINVNTGTTGGNTPANNMAPYLGFMAIIKY